MDPIRPYDIVVIGFGKAGKTLAARQAAAGKNVALIERSPSMYGGTCINIACIPTKTMLVAAERGFGFDEVMGRRLAVTTRLNAKNYQAVAAGVDVIDAQAKFVDDKTIEASAGDETMLLTAPAIVINTGAVPVVPNIAGISGTHNVVDSTGVQNLKSLPERLGIIGSGPIALEFAGIYNTLGSQVTILENHPGLLGRIEPEIGELARQYMKEDGIALRSGISVSAVRNERDARGRETVVATTNRGEFAFDALLYATGRRANTDALNLAATHIETDERGAIKTDEYLQTSVPGVFAVGDVNGGPQFTYVSLDDFRIVNGYLNGTKDYSLSQRRNVPTATFLDPPLAQVGLTEAQAKEEGYDALAKTVPVSGMPRAHVDGDLRGAFKAVVDAKTGLILGATLFGAQAHELINLVKLAMDNGIPASALANQVFTHPTMAENFNDLFAM